jgi:hypothetical protein
VLRLRVNFAALFRKLFRLLFKADLERFILGDFDELRRPANLALRVTFDSESFRELMSSIRPFPLKAVIHRAEVRTAR